MGIWRFYGLSGEEGLSKQKAMNEWTLGGHEVDAGRLISRATPGGGEEGSFQLGAACLQNEMRRQSF